MFNSHVVTQGLVQQLVSGKEGRGRTRMSHILRLWNTFLFCLLLQPKSHLTGEHHKAKMTDSEFRNLELAFNAAQTSYFLHLCEMTVPYHLPPTNNLDSYFIEKIEVIGNDLIHLPTTKPLNSMLLYRRSLLLWWTWSPSFYQEPFSSWPLGLMTSRFIKHPVSCSYFSLIQHLTVTQSFLLKIFTQLWVPLKSLSSFFFPLWTDSWLSKLYIYHIIFFCTVKFSSACLSVSAIRNCLRGGQEQPSGSRMRWMPSQRQFLRFPVVSVKVDTLPARSTLVFCFPLSCSPTSKHLFIQPPYNATISQSLAFSLSLVYLPSISNA